MWSSSIGVRWICATTGKIWFSAGIITYLELWGQSLKTTNKIDRRIVLYSGLNGARGWMVGQKKKKEEVWSPISPISTAPYSKNRKGVKWSISQHWFEKRDPIKSWGGGHLPTPNGWHEIDRVETTGEEVPGSLGVCVGRGPLGLLVGPVVSNIFTGSSLFWSIL